MFTQAPASDIPHDPAAIALRLLDGPADDAHIGALLDTLPKVRAAELDPWVAARIAEVSDDLCPQDLAAIAALIDLTSLSPEDTPESVQALVAKAVAPGHGLPSTAAVCVHADLVSTARQALDAQGELATLPDAGQVALAAVAGAFPHGRSPLAVRAAEVSHVVTAGADEVDIVIDRGALLAGRWAEVYDWVALARRLVQRPDGTRARLKVILESGDLPSYDLVFRAAIIALLGGADMLKTSTGKGRHGATPAAAAILLQAVAHWRDETGLDVGVKISGGVRTVAQAAQYLHLARALNGTQRADADHLRFGASSLLDDVIARVDPLR